MLLNTTSTIKENARKILFPWDLEVESYSLSNFGCYEDQIATSKNEGEASCNVFLEPWSKRQEITQNIKRASAIMTEPQSAAHAQTSVYESPGVRSSLFAAQFFERKQPKRVCGQIASDHRRSDQSDHRRHTLGQGGVRTFLLMLIYLSSLGFVCFSFYDFLQHKNWKLIFSKHIQTSAIIHKMPKIRNFFLKRKHKHTFSPAPSYYSRLHGHT